VKQTILVIGGCKSGKSRHALELSEKISKTKRIFIATSVPLDDEMTKRIDRHKQQRDKSWETVEAPIELSAAIHAANKKGNVILIDCLTLWINNLLMKNKNPDGINQYVDELIYSIKETKGSIILVSNEVGAGIVPENSLARQFRDLAGLTNQKIAQCADRVIWMVAGIPVSIK
jgi:adenosylcobinamide kinase/adenosylcobinamide-phosphate guanylyltransferase